MRSKLGIGISVLGIAILVGTIMSNNTAFPSYSQSQTTQNQCDLSYPDFCISPYLADLDCEQIPYHDFRVLQPDRHGFDEDHDGIGCER